MVVVCVYLNSSKSLAFSLKNFSVSRKVGLLAENSLFLSGKNFRLPSVLKIALLNIGFSVDCCSLSTLNILSHCLLAYIVSS